MVHNRARARFENGIERSLRGVFKRYGDESAKAYTNGRPTPSIENGLRSVLHPHYRRVVPRFGRMTFEAVTKQNNGFFRKLAEDYIATFGATAIKRISDTAKELINEIIDEGIAAGHGAAVVAVNIRKRLATGAVTRARARTIARTETHNAATYASQETAKDLDIPGLQKQWVANTVGGRTRSTHLAMNGVTIGLDDKFSVPSLSGGFDEMDRPGDPTASAANVIQCRCSLIYVEEGVTTST